MTQNAVVKSYLQLILSPSEPHLWGGPSRNDVWKTGFGNSWKYKRLSWGLAVVVSASFEIDVVKSKIFEEGMLCRRSPEGTEGKLQKQQDISESCG